MRGRNVTYPKGITRTNKSAVLRKIDDIRDWLDKARLALMREDVEEIAAHLNAVKTCTDVAKSYLED